MLTVTLSIGIVTSIVLLNLTGLSAGGIIAPGYLALVLDQPVTLLIVCVTTAATWAFVTLSSRFLFLYGPRRFGLMILTSLLLSAALELLRPTFGALGLDWRSIGYIVPGLIAHQFDRQGFVATLAILAVAAPLVRVLTFVVVR